MRRSVLVGGIVVLLAAVGLAGGLLAFRPAAPVPEAPMPSTPAAAGAAFSILDSPQPLPELRFVDADGRQRSLGDFRGKAVLLNLWATWCVPCREEMPALDRLQARLGGPAFEVVPLSIDTKGLPVVKDFYDQLGLKTLGILVNAQDAFSRY